MDKFEAQTARAPFSLGVRRFALTLPVAAAMISVAGTAIAQSGGSTTNPSSSGGGSSSSGIPSGSSSGGSSGSSMPSSGSSGSSGSGADRSCMGGAEQHVVQLPTEQQRSQREQRHEVEPERFQRRRHGPLTPNRREDGGEAPLPVYRVS